VNDHIIPHVSEKKNVYEIWEALTKFYQSGNQNNKMVLREKLRSTKMSKTDIVASYFTKISQVLNELTIVEEVVKDYELVRTSLNGFSEKWASFMNGFVAREYLLNSHRLWDDFSREYSQEEALQGSRAKGDENEEIVSLHAKKGRGDGKKNMSKVKCFAFHKTGYYAIQCQNKKKSKKEIRVAASTSTEIDDFVEKFEKEFSRVLSFRQW
jgi:hypothetical protein